MFILAVYLGDNGRGNGSVICFFPMGSRPLKESK